MANLALLEPPSAGAVLQSTLVKAVKTAVAAALGVLGTNVIGWTDIATVKAAGIAAVGAGATVLLNLLLTWVNSPTA